MDLDQEKRRGDHADRLLKDELLNEVLDSLEKETLLLWEDTPARDIEGREHLHRFYLICRKFRNTLTSMIKTGEMADIQIKQSLAQKVKTKLLNI